MSAWKDEITEKLSRSGESDSQQNVIWKQCNKLLEDDTGAVTPLEATLAELLLESYGLD